MCAWRDDPSPGKQPDNNMQRSFIFHPHQRKSTMVTLPILLTRSIIILVLFVLASRNIVAYAFATSASFAIHRNRHHSPIIISPRLLTTTPTPLIGNDGIGNDDNHVVPTTRLFSSLTTAALTSTASEETNNNNNKGPWWTRIRIGDGNNRRHGGKRGKVGQTQVDDCNSAGASTVGMTTSLSRPSPTKWPRLLPNMKQLPKLFTSFLTKEKKCHRLRQRHASSVMTVTSPVKDDVNYSHLCCYQ